MADGGSLRKGAPTRGPPRHQNKFAFKHNKNSKKTKVIKQITHGGLCRRCFEKIEWRKKYRKYKPLSAPAICNECHQRTVKRAYHTLCDSCAGGRGVCAKCVVSLADQHQQDAKGQENDSDVDDEAEATANSAVATIKIDRANPDPKAQRALQSQKLAEKKASRKKEDDDDDLDDEGEEDEDLSMEEEGNEVEEDDEVDEENEDMSREDDDEDE
jgi:hypothetical protein